MNITEAKLLNTVLKYVLGIRTGADADVDDQELHDKAGQAAAYLAARAHKTLHAGLTGGDVAEAWDYLELAPWLDPIPYRPTENVPDPKGLLSDPDGPTDCHRHTTRADSRTNERKPRLKTVTPAPEES